MLSCSTRVTQSSSTTGWLLSHPCARVSAALSVFAINGYLGISLKAGSIRSYYCFFHLVEQRIKVSLSCTDIFCVCPPQLGCRCFWHQIRTPLSKGVAGTVVLLETLRGGHATPSNSPGSLLGSRRRSWTMLLRRTEAWLKLTGQLYCSTDLGKAEEVGWMFHSNNSFFVVDCFTHSHTFESWLPFLVLVPFLTDERRMLPCKHKTRNTVHRV